MTTPDFQRLHQLAQLASLVYQTDANVLAKGAENLGFEFVGLVGNKECQAMVLTEFGGQLIVIRGTQVEENFSPCELWDDANPNHTEVGGGAKVRSGAFDPLKDLWKDIWDLVDPSEPLTITGHSLGGQRAAISAFLVPRGVKLSVVAFAPPKGGNKEFWTAAYSGRTLPVIVGRSNDFALSWASLDTVTCQPCPVLHLKEDGGWEMLSSWPFLTASIPDHDVDKYVSDLESLLPKKEAPKE